MAAERWAERTGRALAERSIAWRWAVVPLAVLACLLVGAGASSLRFAGDYRVFFGPENPDFVANERAQGTFGKPDNVSFVVIPRDGGVYTEATLRAVHALTEAAWRLPYVSRVDSLTNFQNTVGVGDELVVEDLLFDPAELSPERVERIRAVARTEPLLDGFVVSRGGEATVVNAVVQLPAGVANAASGVAAEARALRDAIVAAHPGLEIHVAGVASLSAAFEEAGLSDAATLIPAVYALILVAMLVVLRSPGAVAASLLLIALATAVAMGAGGLAGVELTPISLSAPTIVLTIAVADAIHPIAAVRSRMRAGVAAREAVVDATAVNFMPIGVTSLTTVVGFLTLNFSDSPPFHHLGTMSAAGIAAAWLLSVTFLPALLSVVPLGFRPAPEGAGGRVLGARIADAVVARPRAVLASGLLACGAAAAFVPTLTVDDRWSGYFSPALEFRQAVDAAEPYFGTDQVEFVLDPGEPGAVADPSFLRTVDAFAQWLRARPEVAHVYAVSDVLKRVNRNLNNEDPAFHRIPDDRAVASQYLLVYELSLPRGLDLNDRVDIDRRTTRVTASMKDVSTAETRAFLEDARAWFAANGGGYGYVATGSKQLFAHVAERNIRAMFEGTAGLVAAILAILALSFRSLPAGLLSVAANALPIVATFGVWALLVGTVGFSIAAVGAVSVGLVVDFTIHFLARYLRVRRGDGADAAQAVRYALETAGTAIVLTTVILAAGFALLATSAFKLNADLGLLTAIAVVLAMLVNLVVLPSLLLVLERRGARRAAAAAA